MKILNQKLRESENPGQKSLNKNESKKALKEDHSLVQDEELGPQNIQLNKSSIDEEEFTEYNLESPENIELEINQLLFKNIHERLYCFVCEIYKPVRTRHCKKCRRCVKRFDHHCIWTGNCVGQSNAKFFIQFLFYASFTLTSYAIVQVDCIF